MKDDQGYALSLEKSTEEGNSDVLLQVYTKGHFSAHVLLQAMAAQGFANEAALGEGYVRHTHWRNMPGKLDGWTIFQETVPGPGAYPVTMLDVALARRDRSMDKTVTVTRGDIKRHLSYCHSCPDEPCAWAVQVIESNNRQKEALAQALARMGVVEAELAGDAYDTKPAEEGEGKKLAIVVSDAKGTD